MNERGLAADVIPNQADILIVDDTVENIWLLAQILEGQGYSVRKAISSTMALNAVESVLPDLILLDICMPDLDGYTLCRQLKAQAKTAHIPVIFLSALHEALDKVKAFEVGGADYITKPFQAAEVLVRTHNQLQLKQAIAALNDLNLKLEDQVQARTRDLEIANHQLTAIAYHDSLTGLPNRAALMMALARSLEVIQTQPDQQFAVLFLDCDRFKLVNDSFGHIVGDEVLVQIAQRLRTDIQPPTLLTRFGGDEFVVVLTDLDDQKPAIAMAKEILARLAIGIPLAYGNIFISASIGIVFSDPQQHQKPEHILRDADIAMYSAKANGKGRYSIFTPTMQQASLELLQIETDLHQSLQKSEFIPFYQPIINLVTGEICGLEVLIRWQHPERGLLAPNVFMSVAEETGLIIPIGHALLEIVCAQLATWKQQQVVSDNFYLSFNLSVCQITQLTLPACLNETLARYTLAPRHLQLEIIETAVLDNPLSIDIITQLVAQDMHLCIDDFGVGYSSFSYLYQLPIKTLKLDRSFIELVNSDQRQFEIVKAIINIAKALHLTVVAEGVETIAQLNTLRSMDCDLGQGYLFSKPCAAEQIMNTLITRPRW